MTALPVHLSAAERRICAIAANGDLLVDAARQGEPAVFEVRRRLQAARGQPIAMRPVMIGELDAAHARQAPGVPLAVTPGAGSPRSAATDIERLARRVLEDATLLEASDIHLSVDRRRGTGRVTLRVRGKLTHPVHELRADDCDRLLNIFFSELDEGPQTLREGRNQSGAILRRDKLPPGVGGARLQTVWPGEGWHLNIRLRYSQSTLGLKGLDDLGLPERVLADLRYMTTASRGLVLVAGPTESGKSTMLATLTREIWDAAGGLLTIASAEDPVEERHDHLLQIPVNTDEDGDDAWIEAQKLFTRIAPDMGQIGEIRTGEAAERAYSFADTGKLTFATIHVSTALEIPWRLTSGLAISPARALDPAQNPAWTAQRLIALLCPSCRLPGEAPLTRAQSAHGKLRDQPGETGGQAGLAVADRFRATGFDLSSSCRRGPGCQACDPRGKAGLSRGGTPGLIGRRLVLEIVIPDDRLCALLAQGDRRAARNHWISGGGLPLTLQVWDLVQAGLVDLRDYRHHIGGPEDLARDLVAAERATGRATGASRLAPAPTTFAPVVFAPDAGLGGQDASGEHTRGASATGPIATGARPRP